LLFAATGTLLLARMQIIAFRPEYQISVEHAKNRIFYQNFGLMQAAVALPHYLDDWAKALAEVRPGFTILADLQVVNQVNDPELQNVFQIIERLIIQQGVRLLAEVHIPGLPTRSFRDQVNTSEAMPVRYFLNLWEAAQFLDDL
jgi:hypothetical protein